MSGAHPAGVVVMKFGGTSIATAERVQAACDLVAAEEAPPVVVVSAQAGVTSALLDAVDAARRDDPGGRDEATARATGSWRRLVDELGLTGAALVDAWHVVSEAESTLTDYVEGARLLRDGSPRTRDAVAALGELTSHRLVALALRERGVEARAVDPRELVPTDATFGSAQVDVPRLASRGDALLRPLLGAAIVPVTGGFVGACPDGVTTTLGRGGSDLSATHLGAALSAREVQIWTDVDGLMTADPRIVPAARLVPRVSFEEASELASFGARVLHPSTVRPAVDGNVPVRILNTLRPGAEGTTIDGRGRHGAPHSALAVVARKGVRVVTLATSRMLGAHGFLARVFAVFDRHRIPVDVVTTSEISVSLTVDASCDLRAAERELSASCRVSSEEGLALLALVGHGMLAAPERTARAFDALAGLPLRLTCLGASDVNLTFVVREQDADEGVRRLHARFLEDSLVLEAAS